jgi:hypothetical protein
LLSGARFLVAKKGAICFLRARAPVAGTFPVVPSDPQLKDVRGDRLRPTRLLLHLPCVLFSIRGLQTPVMTEVATNFDFAPQAYELARKVIREQCHVCPSSAKGIVANAQGSVFVFTVHRAPFSCFPGLRCKEAVAAVDGFCPVCSRASDGWMTSSCSKQGLATIWKGVCSALHSCMWQSRGGECIPASSLPVARFCGSGSYPVAALMHWRGSRCQHPCQRPCDVSQAAASDGAQHSRMDRLHAHPCTCLPARGVGLKTRLGTWRRRRRAFLAPGGAHGERRRTRWHAGSEDGSIYPGPCSWRRRHGQEVGL